MLNTVRRVDLRRSVIDDEQARIEAQQATQHGRDRDRAATEAPVPGHPGAEPAQPAARLNGAAPLPAEQVFDIDQVMAIGEQRRAVAVLRRPDLAGHPLGEAMGRLMEGQAAGLAATFDWRAPGLFVDARGNDVAADVAPVIDSALHSIGRMPAANAAKAMQNLIMLADGLAELPTQRTALANIVSEAVGRYRDRVSEAVGRYRDRVKLDLGRLMLDQAMHEARKPDAPPDIVLSDLLQRATTRAATAFLDELVGPDAEPSAELMLFACHVVHGRLRAVGIPQRTLFPLPEFQDQADVVHHAAVNQWADALIAELCKPLLGSLGIDDGAAVDMLMKHARTEFEEIFSSRLAHRVESALEPIHLRDEQLQENKRNMSDEDYLGQCGQLLQDSQDARRRIYEKAVRSAFCGTSGVWEVPARPAPA